MTLGVRGHRFSAEAVAAIGAAFLDLAHPTKAGLVGILAGHGVPAPIRDAAAKRLLAHLCETGRARFDPKTGCYAPLPGAPPAPDGAPGPTDPPDALAADHGVHANGPTNPVPADPSQPSSPPSLSAHLPLAPHLPPAARLLCLVISGVAVLSVVAINGLFAASLAGTGLLAAILVAVMVAMDLMRPFLVAVALIAARRGLWVRVCAAAGLAAVLAPLSVFTSFSMLSAAFEAGTDHRAEARASAEQADRARIAIEAEIARLRTLARTQWARWQAECGEGGCGPAAARLQDAAERTEARIAALMTTGAARPNTSRPGTPGPASDARAGITAGLAHLGLPEHRIVPVAPLVLALGMELAAMLGPALLLVPMGPDPPSRRPRRARLRRGRGRPF